MEIVVLNCIKMFKYFHIISHYSEIQWINPWYTKYSILSMSLAEDAIAIISGATIGAILLFSLIGFGVCLFRKKSKK